MATRSLSPTRVAKKLRDHRFAVISLARYLARKAVEAQIKVQGTRPTFTYSPAQLKALAQAEFELNRIALIAEAEKIIATSPLFARYRLSADISTDAQTQEQPKSTTSVLHISGAK